MKVTVVESAERARKLLMKRLKSCESVSWLSAWATMNPVVQALLNDSDKVRHLVIGTHKYFTDPEVLRQAMNIAVFKVVPPTGALFHPKLYAFHFKGRVEIYVGSSNLTGGGLGRNIECGVILSAAPESPVVKKLTSYIEEQWCSATKCRSDFIDSYEANLSRAKEAQAVLNKFILIKKPKVRLKRKSDQDLTWGEFVAEVRVEVDDKGHSVLNQRLQVLAEARKIFASGFPFSKLTLKERKSIAGTLGRVERKDSGFDWGFFGQMSTIGRFTSPIKNNSAGISKALDNIPLTGPINRAQYMAFVRDFVGASPAFSESWIAPPTRLLCMKRPDQFVCIDGPNIKGIASHFGVTPSRLDMSTYWDEIIEPLMLTKWWRAPAPTKTEDQHIWEGRAAMLDAIHYDGW